MKSIKLKLIIAVGSLISVVCIILSLVSYQNALKVLESSTESSLKEVANQSSSTISSKLDGDYKELESIASNEIFADSTTSTEAKVEQLSKEVERIGCLRMAYIETNGDSYSTNGKSQNLADREYFINAMAGETSVTDPSIGKSTGELLVFYGTPVKNDAGEIVAVLQEIQDGNGLSDLSNTVTYGTTGSAYLINSEGTIIADQDNELVMNETNILTMASTDSSYASWAEAVNDALASDSGFTTYTYGGTEYYVGYAAVSGTSWKVMVTVEKSEIMSGLALLKRTTTWSSLIAIIVGIILAYALAHTIAKGIKASSSTLDQLSTGDLTVSVDKKVLRKKDEVGDMARAMRSMSKSISHAIHNIKNNSGEIDEQSERLSLTSDEISVVSQSVAESITEVANGTVQQSERLARITDILHEFGEMINLVVEQINEVDSSSNSVATQAETSQKEMAKINDSVAKVEELFDTFRTKIDSLGESISEINQFTSVINEISSQTNLLALNASIEAARAGEAGRGFAVVAEEIGNLAEQSRESSEKISDLVGGISGETKSIINETSIMNEEMAKQSEVITQTIASFQAIIAAIDDILPKINTAEETVKNVDKLKDTIVGDVNDIAAVAEEVSATSQDISAAAEQLSASIHEMSGIAVTLKESTGDMRDSINTFKIEDENS